MLDFKVNIERTPDSNIIAIIPAFNEERFIASVVFLTKPYVTTVIVVDDGSTDHTAFLAREAGAHVIVIEHGGKAAALSAGFRYAQTLHPAAVVILDGDAQHNPADIPLLVEPVLEDSADVVVGSRFLDRHSNIPRWRQFGQRALTLITNSASGVQLTDSQSGFRAFSSRALSTLKLQSQNLSVESEMQFQIQSNALTIAEVGIGVQYLDKMKRNPVKHGLQILDTVIAIVARRHPLLVFTVPGVALVVVGLATEWMVVRAMDMRHVLLTGHAIYGVLLMLAGLLLAITGIILHSLESIVVRIRHEVQEVFQDNHAQTSAVEGKL
ncbi:MAG: glycosyltransferase family 2 protein [Sulfobacillus sp.]